MSKKIEATPEMVQKLDALKSQVASLQSDIQNDVSALKRVYNGCENGLGVHADQMKNWIDEASKVAKNADAVALADLSKKLDDLRNKVEDYINTHRQMSTSGKTGSGS
ncbi:MAG: hypothetical protein UEU47_12895 [Oscillospiraceae bacterium]|nr:hypothetical protein [Oscillospiraceae bacterium]